MICNSAPRAHREYGWRARLGLVIPTTNTVNEVEWHRAMPDGVTVHSARMPLHLEPRTDHGEQTLDNNLARAVKDLAEARVDVIAYGCTAGSLVSPLNQLTDRIGALAGVPAVASAPALVLACRKLKITRIGLATPYHDAMNQSEIAFFAALGIETVAVAGLGHGANGPHELLRICETPLEDVRALACSVDCAMAQGIVISCTDLPTMPLIMGLEAALGKPILTSNQATLWAALRAVGIDEHLHELGVLCKNA
jgi:maleate isomerase/arylmalonate decarboxylase